jgi:uncharacterized SAM-binding protein YcdF (DUF218 family)
MSYDAILIPGGGVRSGGELPEWIRARFDLVLEHWSGEYLIPLSAGTPHRPPPLDDQGFPVFEAFAGAHFLLEHGVPVEKILVEACSYDTIGNAYFSRALHTDPRGFRNMLVITSAFHLPRTEAVFRWVYGLDRLPGQVQLSFLASPDVGIAPDALAARIEKEQAGLKSIPDLARRLDTLAKLHHWLFTEHGAYNALAWSKTSPSSPLADTY